MAGAITFKLEDRGFSRALLDFYTRFGGDISKIVRAQARLVAVNLTFQTQPFGGSKPTPGRQADEQTSGKMLGEEAIKRDMNYLYTTPERVFYLIREASVQAARAFVKMMKSRQFARAKVLLDRLQITGLRGVEPGDFDGGALHKTRLAAIPGRPRIKRSQKPELIVPDQKLIDNYTKEIQKRVGMAKAGWAHCAQKLGGTSGQTSTDVAGKQQVMIPRWVKRHIASPSVGLVNDQSGSMPNPYVEMTNTVPWIDKCLNAGQMQEALDIQRDKMMRAIEISKEKAARLVSKKFFGF